MKKLLSLVLFLVGLQCSWSQASSAVGLSLGYLTHEEALNVAGTLEYALDPSLSLGAYASYLDLDAPVDTALKGGLEAKYYFLDSFFAGVLGGLQYNSIKVASRKETDWFLDLGLQAGLNFKVGAFSFGPLYQLFYTLDFTNKGRSDKDFVTSHFSAFAKYNF